MSILKKIREFYFLENEKSVINSNCRLTCSKEYDALKRLDIKHRYGEHIERAENSSLIRILTTVVVAVMTTMIIVGYSLEPQCTQCCTEGK